MIMTFSGEIRSYCLAGREIIINQSIPLLQPFLIAKQSSESAPEAPQYLRTNLPEEKQQTSGWICNEIRDVSTWQVDDGFVVGIENVGLYWLSNNGSHVYVLEDGFVEGGLQNLDAILGPPVILALAIQKTWCLHASAVEHKGHTIVFLGESGSGKSTLAYFLSQSNGIRLVADDILPVSFENGKLMAFPDFPQQKLALESQPIKNLPESSPISAVFILEQALAIQCLPLPVADSVKAVIQNTVASRLLTHKLLGQHLNFCTDLVKKCKSS